VAVTLQDAARLTRVPGIGKKTAKRFLLRRGFAGVGMTARSQSCRCGASSVFLHHLPDSRSDFSGVSTLMPFLLSFAARLAVRWIAAACAFA
jgi:hypothetical protein